jgi:DNA mismatch repair protein MutS
LREELLRFEPAEVLVPQSLRECAGFLDFLREMRLHTTPFDRGGFESGEQKLQSHFRTSSLRGFGLENLPQAQEAAALALDYLGQTHLGALGHIRRISLLSTDGWMRLDNATRRNLELVQSLRDGSAKGTLLGLLDETRTGAGRALLRKWVLAPLLQKDRIENRQDAVAELLDNLLLRRDVRDSLKSISDIERLVSRAWPEPEMRATWPLCAPRCKHCPFCASRWMPAARALWSMCASI